MDATIKEALASLFDARAQRCAPSGAASAAVVADHAQFEAVRDSIIRPALEEVAAYLVSRGQAAHVVVGGTAQNTVELALFGADETPRPLHDRFCFIYEQSHATLRMYTHQAEHSQPYGGRVALADVSPAWVQAQFTAWFVAIQPAAVTGVKVKPVAP